MLHPLKTLLSVTEIINRRVRADAGRGLFKSQIVFTDQFFKIDLFRRSINKSGFYIYLMNVLSGNDSNSVTDLFYH